VTLKAPYEAVIATEEDPVFGSRVTEHPLATEVAANTELSAEVQEAGCTEVDAYAA